MAAHRDDVNAVTYVDDSCRLIASGSDDKLIKVRCGAVFVLPDSAVSVLPDSAVSALPDSAVSVLPDSAVGVLPWPIFMEIC